MHQQCLPMNVPCSSRITSCVAPSKRIHRSKYAPCIIQAQSSQNVAWDPDGILPPVVGGHFARRERALGQQHTQQQRTPPPGFPPIVPVPQKYSMGGIPANDGSVYDKTDLKKKLAERYMPIDTEYPGLHILNMEPPVFLVKNFFTSDECKHMIDSGVGTGKLQQSKVGAGNVADTSMSMTMSSRRTSTSILVDETMQQAHPDLRNPVNTLQSKGMKLLGAASMAMAWGRPGKLPLAGQYCYEALQFAQYQKGQFFLEHEDAFPIDQAQSNGFQRSATLLVYLNDVEQGGATTFQYLNLTVQPVCGDALLFFPGFNDGTPDSRYVVLPK